MPMIKRSSSSVSHLWEPPTVVVREIPDSRTKTNHGGDIGLVGVIRDDLIPLSYSDEPGPVGGTLTLRHKDKMYMDSSVDLDSHEDFRDSTFTLEVRRSLTNRVLQDVLFRGKLAAIQREVGESTNGINYHIRDWFVYADAPINMPTFTFSGPLTAGAIFQAMVNGYYKRVGVENGVLNSITTTFPQYPWPTDSNGNDVASIDTELLEWKEKPATVALRGQPLAQAFTDVLRKINPNLIPSLRYDGAFTYLTGVRRGDRDRELVVNACGTNTTSASVMCNSMGIVGNEDFSNLYNFGQALGGFRRKVEAFDLEKGWTDEEEAAVIANENLLNTYGYKHVGRRYFIPRKAFWMSGTPHGPSTLNQSNRVKLARRNTLAGGDWSFFEPDVEVPKQKKGVIRKGNPVDRLDIHPDDAGLAVVEFKTPLKYYYYTDAQTTLQQAGTAVGSPSIGFYELKCEATSIDLPLEARYAASDDFPRPRTLTISNPNAIKYNYVSHIDFSDNNDMTISTTAPDALKDDTGSVRDDTSLLLDQLEELIQESSRPDININVRIWFFDPTWRKGDRVKRIRDINGKVLYDDLNWYVESAHHDLRRWTTTLRLSSAYQELTSRQLVA